MKGRSRWTGPSEQRPDAVNALEDALAHARGCKELDIQLLVGVLTAAAAVAQHCASNVATKSHANNKAHQAKLSEAFSFVLDCLPVVTVDDDFTQLFCSVVNGAYRNAGGLNPTVDQSLFEALLKLLRLGNKTCEMTLLCTIVELLNVRASELAEHLPAAAALFVGITHQQPGQELLLVVVKGIGKCEAFLAAQGQHVTNMIGLMLPARCLEVEWDDAAEEQCVACFDSLFEILERIVHSATFLPGTALQDQLIAQVLLAIQGVACKDKSKSRQHAAIRARARQQLKQLNQLAFSICRYLQSRPQTSTTASEPTARRSLKPGGARLPAAADTAPKNRSTDDSDSLRLATLGMLGCFAELHSSWFTSQWGLYLSESADLAGGLVDIVGAGHRGGTARASSDRYTAKTLVHELWHESGFEAWGLDNDTVMSRPAKHVRLESVILASLLTPNSLQVRCAAARCLLRVIQATELTNWFATAPTSSSRNRSRRPAASLAQSITGTMVTTMQALFLCLLVEDDEVVVELLLACFTAILGKLPLSCVSLMTIAQQLRPCASADNTRSSSKEVEEVLNAKSPPSAFILKRHAKKMWSLPPDVAPLCTCERIIEAVLHLQFDWAFGLNHYPQSRQGLQLVALKTLNDQLTQLCRAEKVCTKIPRCVLVPLLLKFPTGNVMTTLLSSMSSGGPHSLHGRNRALAVSISTACSPACLTCWDAVCAALVRLVGSEEADLRHTSLDVMEAFLRTRLFMVEATNTNGDSNPQQQSGFSGSIFEMMISSQLPDPLLADMTLAFSDATHAVRTSAAYCVAHLVATDWVRYGNRAQVLLDCLLRATTDKVGAVRAASFNALGHAMSRVLLNPATPMYDAQKLIVDAVLLGASDSKLAVRIQGVWALGTLAQALIPELSEEGSAEGWLEKWEHMCSVGLNSLEDSDKIISSALRTLGYLGRGLAMLAPSAPLIAQLLGRLVDKAQSSASVYFEEKFKSNVCRAIGVIVKEPRLQATLQQTTKLPEWVTKAVPHLSHLLTSTHVKVQMYAAAALYHISSSISNVEAMVTIVEALFQSIARLQEAGTHLQDRAIGLPPRQTTECNFQLSRLLRRVLEIAGPPESTGVANTTPLAEEVLFRIGYYSKDLLAWLSHVAEAAPLLPDVKIQLKTSEAAKNARLTAQLLLHIFSSRQGELNVLQNSVQEALQALCEPVAIDEELISVSSRLDVEMDDEL